MKYNEEMLRNAISGAALLGAGGGGSPVQGNMIVDEIMQSKGVVEVRSPNEVPDRAFGAVVAGMGAPSASRTGWRDEHLRGVEMFAKNFPKKLEFVIPFEVGAGNSAVALHCSAFMKVPVVDGDGAGRAVPELQLSTFDIYGISPSPMSIAGASSEGAMIFAKTALSMEIMARALCQTFGNCAGTVSYPMDGAAMKRIIVPDTMTLCEKTGKVINDSKPSGEKISERLQKEIGMVVLGRGQVTKKVSETRGGFDYGHVDVEQKGGGALSVFFKNENILALKNGKIVAMIPDLVCWLSEDGEPMTNADVEKGRKVFVLGLEAHKLLRTKKAIAAFQHLYAEQGHDVEYKAMK